MNYYDIFTLTQQAEIENPTLFPFPFNMHLIFACLATVFFVYRFATQKLPYQLIMAIAIPASLLIWVSESRTLFYAVGIIELVLILSALVTLVSTLIIGLLLVVSKYSLPICIISVSLAISLLVVFPNRGDTSSLP